MMHQQDEKELMEKRTKKSIIPGDREDMCFLCHQFASSMNPLQVHHCIHGTGNRRQADRYGLTVHLCMHCHMALHDRGEHDIDLERKAQAAFERGHSREEFMQIFGKSWL